MSDTENTIEDQGLTKETFSFFDVLNEVNYPTETIEVYLNENAAYQFGKLRREINESGLDVNAPLTGATAAVKKQIKGYKDRLAKIRSDLDDSKFTFHLKGVSNDRIVSARDVVEEKFNKRKKQQKAADGTIRKYLPEEEQVDYVRYLDALIIALHVEQVVAPNGAVNTSPDVDEIAAFFDGAPTAAQEKLRSAVQELRVDAEEYERAIDEGF